LARTRGTFKTETIVVCDGPRDDGGLRRAMAECPVSRVLYTLGQSGYAAACNLGISAANGKYVVLLNNDLFVTPDWLAPLVKLMDAEPQMAAVGPKVLSLRRPGYFDYSGGAGGWMDRLGYPFTQGRLFQTVERDEGQYDQTREVFWVGGCAVLLRRLMVLEVGKLDERLYMQMEEIDLCWRLRRRGYKISICPTSSVYHYDGYSLSSLTLKKTYLNHRNNLIILFKNSPCSAFGNFLFRLALEGVTVGLVFIRPRKWRHSLAALGALVWLALNIFSLVPARRRTQRLGNREYTLSQGTYHGSIVWDYFVRGIQRASQLLAV